MKRLTIVLIIILQYFSFSALAKSLVDKIVATVNDEIILLSELAEMPLRIDRQGAVDETLLLGRSLDSIKTDKSAQLQFLIREKLVDFEIKRLGLSMSNEQAEAELEQMSRKNNMSLPEFAEYIKTQGLTLDDYKKIVKARSERQRFFENEIVRKLRISDEDAYGVFKAKFPKYRPSTSEFKIAQIFFSNKKGGASAASDRAARASEKLSAGESFESLANQIDETPGSNKDGVLGVFRSGEFIPEIEKSIESMSVGNVSGVLKGPNGFHIIKLLDRKTTHDPNFLKAKENIKAALIQQSFEKQLKNWFEIKTHQAVIKINKDAL